MSSFWERRRAAVEAEARAEAAAEVEAARVAQEASLAEKTDEELLAELNLPDPETLTEGDDFKQFLTEAVPARLRTRALRRLWRVNPVLANVDGLLEYGEDYTDAATVVENLQTAYQVGKGMLAHVEELARQAEAKAGAADDIAETETIIEDEVTAPDTDAAVAQAEPDLGGQALPENAVRAEVGVEENSMPAAHRRMQFTFDTEGAT